MDKPKNNLSRREFFKSGMLGSAGMMIYPMAPRNNPDSNATLIYTGSYTPYTPLLDLAPASWIWFPSARTLQNSVFLFRKTLMLDSMPLSARGWILADSRYKLYVNGTYLQFGPAPSDPRKPEADPADILHLLKPGENTIGIEVLYYGTGEGTWPTGKPGLIMNIHLTGPSGNDNIVTDGSWMVSLAESWKPGQYKRWYLRAFQEEFDARLYPYGWNRNEYKLSDNWMPAMVIDLSASNPPISSPYDEYQQEIRADHRDCDIRERSIPLMKEFPVSSARLADSFLAEWKGDPNRFFEFLTPGLYMGKPLNGLDLSPAGTYSYTLTPTLALVLTFEFEEQLVGFPYFTIDAPEGTVIELMVQEGHQPGNLIIMNNRLHSWTRFICREGKNEFRTYDYESLRWIQLHIHGPAGRVSVSNVGVTRRMSGWDRLPDIKTSDEGVNRVMAATINTLVNSAQDLLVDGMGRERQQYSGDVGHQIHALMAAFNDFDLPKRYINTFSQGITLEGYFMDSWPAYDRMARIAQRQLGLTMWGPIIDHGIGFVFDCYYYYFYSGNLEAMHEVYPRLLHFYNYLSSLIGQDNLLPVEDLGVTWVWMDTDAYLMQKHKQCSFNLYAAAMMMKALAPIAIAFKDLENARLIADRGKQLHKNTIEKYWDAKSQLFIDNLPWQAEEGNRRISDRSLAMAVIYDLCPDNQTDASVKALEAPPVNMRLSFPANAIWRLWALGKAGKADAIIDEINMRWLKMDSVRLNNTLQEHWSIQPDTRGQWSHCAAGPLVAAYNYLAGITPAAHSKTILIKPNPGKLTNLSLGYNTPEGRIDFLSSGSNGNRTIEIEVPDRCRAVLLLDNREKVNLETEQEYSEKNFSSYRLKPGTKTRLRLKYT